MTRGVSSAARLEFERVSIIDTDMFPQLLATSDKQKIQEDNLMYVAITRAIQQLSFVGTPFSCLQLPGDELEPYAPGLVVADETEQEGEVPVATDPMLEELIASLDEDLMGQPHTKRGCGRPQKRGANAGWRKGFEVTFDLRKELHTIRATLGVQAAWEASEAVILFVDPQRTSFP